MRKGRKGKKTGPRKKPAASNAARRPVAIEHRIDKADVNKKFCRNIIIGLLVAAFLHLYFLHTVWGEASINFIFDAYFNRWEARERLKDDTNAGKVAFITITPEPSDSEGEEAQITPRDEVAKAIRIARDRGARVIYTDVKFENADYQHPEKDAELRKVLEETGQRGGVDLILPVGIKEETGQSDGVSSILPTGGKKVRKLKYNIFNEIIDKYPNIHRALPVIVASSADSPVFRFWREYEWYERGEKKEILWGVPLLVAILKEGNAGQLEACRSTVLGGQPGKITLSESISIRVTTAEEDPYLQRIRFSLIPPYVLPGEKGSGNLVRINIPVALAEHMEDTWRDKVVIIGNPGGDFGDVHLTPVGEMAGMYVMGNAIKTVLDGKQVTSAPLWLDLCLEGLMILLTAFIFSVVPAWLAKVGVLPSIDISTLIFILGIILTLVFICWIGYGLYIHYGIFINAVLFGFLIGFFETVTLIEEVVVGLAGFLTKGRGKHGEKVVAG